MKAPILIKTSILVINIVFIVRISAQESIFDFEFTNPDKLPSLVNITDEKGIMKAYSLKDMFSFSVYDEYYDPLIYKPDVRVNDMVNLFNKFITDELVANEKEKYGYLRGLYSNNKKPRYSNLNAAKMALQSINEQITSDFENLEAKLLTQ